MDGDERKRFCALCQKHVYNIADMSRAEAETLIAGVGEVCVRLYKRPDGTVITSDCPVGKRRIVLRNSITYASAGLAAALLIGLLDKSPGMPLHDFIQDIANRLQGIAPGQHLLGTVSSNITSSN